MVPARLGHWTNLRPVGRIPRGRPCNVSPERIFCNRYAAKSLRASDLTNCGSGPPGARHTL
jgi:hypothetical protein